CGSEPAGRYVRYVRYVLMRTPLGVLRVSTRGRPPDGTPFSNSRFPSPSTNGKTQMRYWSTSSAAISVCSNSLLPQMCNAGPSDAFSRRTSSTDLDFSRRLDLWSEPSLALNLVGGGWSASS